MKPTLLLLHGFTGAPSAWSHVREALRDDYEIVAPTLAGHVHTPLLAESFDDEVTRLLGLITANGPVELAGYSLGARLGLALLVRAPERFIRATLIGVHPGLRDPEQRSTRLAADARWAALLRERGVEAFVDRWSAQPLFASQGRVARELLAEQRAIRLGHDAEGLARALETFSLGRMPSYWERLPELSLPVTLAVGELDGKFVELAGNAVRELGCGRLFVAPNTGHNLLLEQPASVARAIALGHRT